MLRRRVAAGFTLIELVVAMSVTLLVSGAIYQLLVATQRLTRAQSEHLMLQSSVRNAALVVLNELRDLNTAKGLGPDHNDILSGTSTAVSYRASRGFGVLCQPASATQIRLARSTFVGARDPQPGRDSVYVFLEGDGTRSDDDLWQGIGITGVSTSGGCAGTAEPGITLTVPSTASIVGLGEIMELRLYQSESKWWLGMRSVTSGEVIQPLAGPLASDGLRLQYLDRTGGSTMDLSAVRSISVAIRGIGAGVTRANDAALSQELVSEVVLRNSGSE
jgi:prepilin-type N-terminal cleavage/methylation domain-containing protein